VAIRSGLAAQLGIAAEDTWGTYKVPNHFAEFLSEEMKYSIERVESKGLRANNRVLRSDRYAPGKKRVEGKVSLEPATKGFGLWLKHALGTSTITTPSGATLARLHSHTLGDPYGLGLTMQVGRPDSAGTVQPFSYTGCKFAGLTMSNAVDEILKAEFDVVGQDETTSQSLATATYPITSGAASYEYLYWTGGTIKVAGSTVGVVTDFSVEVKNGLKDDRYFLGGATMSEPIIADMVEISGKITVEFSGLTAYQRFTQNTTASVNAKWLGQTAIESTTMPYVEVNIPTARFDGETPTVNGPGVITHDLNFKALYDGTNGPINIDYLTSDTAS
jgi:hypothetical protein